MKKHDLKDDIGYWLNRLRMQVHQSFEDRLEAYDVTIAQWCILLALYNESAASITELSKFIEVDKASVSRVVDRLLLKQLVTNQQGADRRSGFIQLTSKGVGLVPLLIKEAEANEQQFFGRLIVQEYQQLRHLFHKLFLNLPSIQMSGWLSNTEDIMNKDLINIIEHNSDAGFSGEYSFPQVVKNLIKGGIEIYYTDLITLQKTYYATDGSAYTSKLPYSSPPKRGEKFSEHDIKESVRASLRGDIMYPEFLNRVIKAGVVNYTVFLLGKQVHYIGAKGEIYVEHFPKEKQD